jgi:DNA helicase II / ATP-dependent DNA helicase PcrA
MDYTPTQLEAISCLDNNLQIIACAGSGKTQVIAARIANLLKEKRSEGVTPANVVAFTFTEKAAGELKDRIHHLVREALGTDQGLAEMYVGTIHGYCLNLLQSPPLYKYLKYRVLTDVQQRLLIDRYSNRSGLSQVPLLDSTETLQRWKDSSHYQALLSVLGEGNVDFSKVPPPVVDAVQKYYALLEEERFLDFTMIIATAVAELKTNPTLRDHLAASLKYLVVDEYQDVNPLQELLISELHGLGANLCVVGDDDQTIYQWRGSDVSNILHFATRYPNVTQVALTDNFRSTRAIVESARRVVELNPERLPKKMLSTDAQPHAHGNLLARQFADIHEEAAWIAQKVLALHSTPYQDKQEGPERGLAFSDFAILLRSVRRDGDPIVAALAAADIPFVIGGMNGLFNTPEIQAVRDVFYYLSDFPPPGSTSLTTNDVRGSLGAADLGLSTEQIEAGIRLLEERKSKIGPLTDATLFLQRVYLDFLDAIAIREDAISAPGRSGEIVYYNLGKFSQVITDFEQIHTNSGALNLYRDFAGFLCFQAPSYYPEGWEDAGFARPDAVQVMTVHQAKGMQWPAVFVPCLRANRFPSQRFGGRSVWHIIPSSCVEKVDRYLGTEPDERRLFYVALTRAERYLFCSFAPIPDNRNQRRISKFIPELTASHYVLSAEPRTTVAPSKIAATPRKAEISLVLTFSELKYYFECPYQFKLRFLYGFNAPISRALGYGKSLHDALAHIHAESIRGRVPTPTDVPELVEEHLFLPFANPEVQDHLRTSAEEALARYLQRHQDDLTRLEHAEKIIELDIGDGIVVNGRIDLIRRTDTDELVIVDFKSDERAQAEEITARQLQIYAVGYQQLTGRLADLIEVHNLDHGGTRRELVDTTLVTETTASILIAGNNIRNNTLPRLPVWTTTCSNCEVCGLCRTRATNAALRPTS